MFLHGLEAKIAIRHDDEPDRQLKESKVEASERECSAYVCSTDGARLVLSLERDPTMEADLAIELVLDGKVLSPYYFYRYPNFNPGGYQMASTAITNAERAPFIFKKINLARPAQGDAGDRPEQLGSIELRVYHVKVTGLIARTWFGSSRQPAWVDEAALKERKKFTAVPLEHRIDFDRQRIIRPLPSCQFSFEYVTNDPIATFKYKYASRDVLEASGILPQFMAAVPTGNFRAFALQLQASNTELREKIERLEARLNGIKQEFKADVPKVIECIDLTQDDDDDDDDAERTLVGSIDLTRDDDGDDDGSAKTLSKRSTPSMATMVDGEAPQCKRTRLEEDGPVV